MVSSEARGEVEGDGRAMLLLLRSASIRRGASSCCCPEEHLLASLDRDGVEVSCLPREQGPDVDRDADVLGGGGGRIGRIHRSSFSDDEEGRMAPSRERENSEEVFG